ncbi:hypothetical protein [uncultured Desulfosarcina sp.]|uniref:hypothetical protein n=1 Tax=uncultured Desulfosarcina sp. TaxID=218289 RepID=UPI0029C6F986|nr:hypothetical protein [uncultured Desulfosarcina sp.]
MSSMIKIITVLLFLLPGTAMADWTETLKSNFDHAETFDSINDWRGHYNYDRSWEEGGNIASDFPYYDSGENTPIKGYANYGPVSGSDSWISSRSSDLIWNGEGKSLLINYAGSDGPARIGFGIAENDPTYGYSDGYAFAMVRIPRTFFSMNAESFNYYGYLKLLDLEIGWKHGGRWGTDTENETYCSDERCSYIYGYNDVMINLYPSGSSMYLKLNSWVGSNESKPLNEYITSIDVGGPIRENQWFAIEFHIILGNNNDGTIEIRAYDESGNELPGSPEKITKITTFATFLDHKINRLLIGGNYSGSGTTGYIYFDDIIFDDGPIGSKYFQLLNGNDSTEEDASDSTEEILAPKNFKVVE